MGIPEKVKEIIGTTLSWDPDSLMSTMKLENDLNADSLDIMHIKICVEDNFDLPEDTLDTDNLATVGAWIDATIIAIESTQRKAA